MSVAESCYTEGAGGRSGITLCDIKALDGICAVSVSGVRKEWDVSFFVGGGV
ncbi:MAG TPA: hypothetical protein PLT82_11955 [Candidatus Hydrogenedens sp.]|nr:hypothetical protein [Candidatus Hydrogenedens sp.]HPP59835.1 hypothetical protein [Candidatus Hydrogenedens sp.]